MRVKNTVTINGKRYVCRIFDAGDGDDTPADRYTIAYKGYRPGGGAVWYPYTAASAHPFHPLGVGLHSESQTFLTGRHLGKRVSFETLPVDVQKLIIQDLTT